MAFPTPGEGALRQKAAGNPEGSGSGPILVERATLRGPAIQPRRWGWIESAVLAGYAVVVALGIAWHEPWADEAQAWLIARSLGWWQMMFHAIRYEGSPGLWHTFCWILIRLHIGFVGLHWASGVMAAAGVAVLLRYAPFPLILRVLLPFGFWLAYQDAVVARSYVLFAILAFPAAAILRGMMLEPSQPLRKGRLLWLGVLLGLMANLSVHGFVISIGLALVTLALLRRRRRAGVRPRAALPAAVVGCFWIFAVATTFPPSNVSFIAGRNFDRSKEKILASLGDRQAKLELKHQQGNQAPAVPGELRAWTPPPPHWTAAQARWHKIARVLSLFTYPISNYRVLALLLCVLVIAQAVAFRAGRGQAGWIGLMPWLLMILVFSSMYIAPRHAGMLWTALLLTLWLTWPAALPAGGQSLWLHRAMVAVLVLVALDQVWWTAHSVWADVHQPYSGDVAMAQFLKENGANGNGEGKRIAGFYYYTVGVNAWFPHKVFFNQPAAYWKWEKQVRVNQQAPMTLATHPDIVVVGLMSWGKRDSSILADWSTADDPNIPPYPLGDVFGIAPYAQAHGYRLTHRFCGHAFMRAAYAEDLCMEALEPKR